MFHNREKEEKANAQPRNPNATNSMLSLSSEAIELGKLLQAQCNTSSMIASLSSTNQILQHSNTEKTNALLNLSDEAKKLGHLLQAQCNSANKTSITSQQVAKPAPSIIANSTTQTIAPTTVVTTTTSSPEQILVDFMTSALEAKLDTFYNLETDIEIKKLIKEPKKNIFLTISDNVLIELSNIFIITYNKVKQQNLNAQILSRPFCRFFVAKQLFITEDQDKIFDETDQDEAKFYLNHTAKVVKKIFQMNPNNKIYSSPSEIKPASPSLDIDALQKDCKTVLNNWLSAILNNLFFYEASAIQFSIRKYNGDWYLPINVDKMKSILDTFNNAYNTYRTHFSIDDTVFMDFILTHFNNFINTCKPVIEDENEFTLLLSDVIKDNPHKEFIFHTLKDIKIKSVESATKDRPLHSPKKWAAQLFEKARSSIFNFKFEPIMISNIDSFSIKNYPIHSEQLLLATQIQLLFNNKLANYVEPLKKGGQLINILKKQQSSIISQKGFITIDLTKTDIELLISGFYDKVQRVSPQNIIMDSLVSGLKEILMNNPVKIPLTAIPTIQNYFAFSPHEDLGNKIIDIITEIDKQSNEFTAMFPTPSPLNEKTNDLYTGLINLQLYITSLKQEHKVTLSKQKIFCYPLLITAKNDKTKFDFTLATAGLEVTTGFYGIYPAQKNSRKLIHILRLLPLSIQANINQQNEIITFSLNHIRAITFLEKIQDMIAHQTKGNINLRDMIVFSQNSKHNKMQNSKISLPSYINNLSKQEIMNAKRTSAYQIKKSSDTFNFQELMQLDFNTQPFAVNDSEKSWNNLFDYQKESVNNILSLCQKNIGVLLADDMGLGKTIQIGHAIKQTNQFPFLIIAPFSVLDKWSDELMEKCGFRGKDVIIYHGSNRTNNIKDLQDKVILTTYDTARNEMTNYKRSPLRDLAGFIDFTVFAEADQNLLDLYYKVLDIEIIKLIDRKIPNLFTLKKKGFILLKLPNNEELEQFYTILKKNTAIKKIELADLAKLCLSIFIFQKLQDTQAINHLGVIEYAMVDLDDINEELSFLNDEQYSNYKHDDALIIKLDTITKKLAKSSVCQLKGIAIDEGHIVANNKSKISKLIGAIFNTVERHKGVRLIVTGTPFQNKMQELWTLLNYLNDNSLLTEKEFNTIYINILQTTAEAMRIENTDLNYKLETTLNQFYELTKKINLILIRRRKTDATIANNALGKLPSKRFDTQNYELSPTQSDLYNQLDPMRLENACRGFAFANTFNEKKHNEKKLTDSPDSESEITPGKIEPKKLIGFALLNYLGKLIEHPILVDHDYHEKFYPKRTSVFNLDNEIALAIKERYNGNIDNFINDSGKVAAFMKIMEMLLKNKENKILVPVSSIPMIAILDYCIRNKLNNTVHSLVFSGELSKEQRNNVSDLFNRTNNYQIIFLSIEAGGMGIDLFASHVVPFNNTWNPFTQMQAIDRAVRASHHNSQQKTFATVNIIELKSNNPYDQKLYAIGQEKYEWSRLFIEQEFDYCNLSWLLERIYKHLILTYPMDKDMRESLNKFYDMMKLKINSNIAKVIPDNAKRAAESELSDEESPHKKIRSSTPAATNSSQLMQQFGLLNSEENRDKMEIEENACEKMPINFWLRK